MTAALAVSLPMVLAMAGLAGCGGSSTPGDEPDAGGPAAADAGLPPELARLHVPSPAWEDQIIYFLMVDRFADGDPANNDQGAGEHDPADPDRYSGGDLQGVIDQLDYIRALGATAVWITPPVANQWWDPLAAGGAGGAGYHGYWAMDFKSVDPHLGTLETYQDLSRALHQRGMYLIQDIVTNHVGNFFTYVDPSGNDGFDPEDPAQNLRFNSGAQPAARPTQAPFDQNDVTNPDHAAAGIYHWTSNLAGDEDESARLSGQLSDLDDLDTGNPAVRQALRDSYGHWVREVGVDAFGMDAVRYVEHDFLHDFLHGTDAAAPGIEQVALDTGREDFLTFGQAAVASAPLDDSGERQAGSYLGTDQAPELDAVLGLPLSATLARVLAEGQPSHHLGYRLERAQDPEIYGNPWRTPVFLDNHAAERFLARGSTRALEQALLVLMTIPGIPVIYYGTEQGLSESRASMFATGWGAGGQDHFDRDSALFRHIQTLAQMRRDHPVLTRGTLRVLQDETAGPGVLAYLRQHEDQSAIVIINTADRATLLGGLDTRLTEGRMMRLLAGIERTDDVRIGKGGSLTMTLAARESMVLLATDELGQVETPGVTITVITPIEGAHVAEDVLLTGNLVGTDARDAGLMLVIDGNLEEAIEVATDDSGAWSVVIPLDRFPPGESAHTLMLYAAKDNVVSARYSFTVSVPEPAPAAP